MSNLTLEIRPQASCDYHRLVLPFNHITVRPKVPVYMFNRIPGHGRDLLKMKRAGWRIVCDVDDYWHLDPDHYLYGSFKKSGMGRRIEEAIRVADVVTTTTAELADKIKPLNKNVHIIPNALPFDTGQFTRSTDKSSGRYFVWAGGASHKHDLSQLSGLFANVEIAGYSARCSEWGAIKNIATGALFTHERQNTRYMSAYDGHKVALAPLLQSAFNSCKSNLKVLEAGAKGIPVIASAVKPYLNDVDRNAVTYCASRGEWHDAMKRLKSSATMAHDMGERLAEHVRNHYHLNDANRMRRQLLESFT